MILTNFAGFHDILPYFYLKIVMRALKVAAKRTTTLFNILSKRNLAYNLDFGGLNFQHYLHLKDPHVRLLSWRVNNCLWDTTKYVNPSRLHAKITRFLFRRLRRHHNSFKTFRRDRRKIYDPIRRQIVPSMPWTESSENCFKIEPF